MNGLTRTGLRATPIITKREKEERVRSKAETKQETLIEEGGVKAGVGESKGWTVEHLFIYIEAPPRA